MKKSFRKLFSGLAGLLIVGVLFGIVIQARAATNYGTLASEFTVTAPNGGETLSWTTEITWTTISASEEVDLWYCEGEDCTNASFTLIAWGQANSWSYSWDTTTADGDSDEYKIRVSLTWGSNWDISNGYFTIDNTAPTGWSFSINNGAAYTNSRSVTLDTTCATDTISSWVQVAFGNSANPDGWTSCTSSMSHNLTVDDGTKTVYMRFKDAAWNVTADIIHSIVFDETAPIVDVWADIVTSGTVTIYWTGNWGIAWPASYLWLNDDSEDGALTTPGGDTNVNLNVSNANPNWTYTVRLVVVDNAGNTGYDTMELTWDTVAPTVYSVETTPNPASGTIAVVVTFTETLAWINTAVAPTILLDVPGDDGYTVSAVADGSHTNGYQNSNHLVREWTINVAARVNTTAHFHISAAADLAGNIMTANNNVGSLTIDTAWPTYTINNGTEAGPVKNDVINVTLNDIDGVSFAQYGFSADSTCDGSDTYGNSFSSATNFTIAGDHTDYLCFKTIDNIGNISYTWGFLLNTDNTAPTIQNTTLLTPNGWENLSGGMTYEITWNSGQITDTNLWSTPITLKYSLNGWTSWTTIATAQANDGSYSWTVPNADTNVALVVIIATDLAGNGDADTSYDTSAWAFTIDSTNPIVHSVNPSFLDIDDFYTNDTTPTFTGYVTDNLTNIVSVEYSLDDGTTWTWVTAVDESFNSTWEEYTITTDILSEWNQYIAIRATDAVGHTTTSEAYHFYVDTHTPTVTFNIPTDASTKMNIAGNAINTGASPISNVEYFIDTIGDDGEGIALTLSNNSEPLYFNPSKNFNGSIGLTGISNGTHNLYVHARNLAGTRWPTVYDSFNVNAEAPDITELYMSDVSSTHATINWGTNVEPDTAMYRFKPNNWTFTGWATLDESQILDVTANTTYVVEIKVGIWDNYSTDTISFTTAAATDGIVVDSLTRILNGSTPTAGGGYASGYHFRFNLTINDILMDTLNFKLADWSNSATTMAVANNTKVYVSTNGIDNPNYDLLSPGRDVATLTGSNVYSSDMHINNLDANTSKWGKQVTLDMFYKIPTGAQGIFSTSYGIKVSATLP